MLEDPSPGVKVTGSLSGAEQHANAAQDMIWAPALMLRPTTAGRNPGKTLTLPNRGKPSARQNVTDRSRPRSMLVPAPSGEVTMKTRPPRIGLQITGQAGNLFATAATASRDMSVFGQVPASENPTESEQRTGVREVEHDR